MFNLKNKPGLLLTVVSLLIYCLLKMPLNLSVVGTNENEGFKFLFGQSFLMWGELSPGRGILLVFPYAMILKIFGFNTYAIIATHILETVVLVLIGILLYFLIKQITESELYGGIATLLWTVLVSTPIGGSGLPIEIRAHYTLHGECFCTLYSLFSLWCMSLSGFFKGGNISSFKEKFLMFTAGLLAVCSFMSKTNGGVLLLAVFIYILTLLFFKREHFYNIKSHIKYFFSGVILSFLFFNMILYFYEKDLYSYWKDYLLIGSYTTDHLKSFTAFFHDILKFMSRNTVSLNNFLLFLFTFMLFAWGIIKGTLNQKKSYIFSFWLFISIWGIGNICAIIIPGEYQPYYYHLIWPSVAITLSLFFYTYKTFLRKSVLLLFVFIFTLLFCHRIIISIPTHYELAKNLSLLSIFNQTQSFQDPVIPYDPNSAGRDGYLQLADTINILLPEKNQTFYFFNFGQKGPTGLTPLSYIYAKRYAPTSIDCGLLKISNIAQSKLKILKRDLLKRIPEIFILSKDIYLEPWQTEIMKPFIAWLSEYVRNNFKYETTFNFSILNEENKIKNETFVVYRRVKKLN